MFPYNMRGQDCEERMTAVNNQNVWLAQANGPDVELVGSDSTLYATYKAPQGYAAIYDHDLGLYCYADLQEGSYVSTDISVGLPAPPGLPLQLMESGEARARKSEQQAQSWSRQSHTISPQEPLGP
jgi:hypothetical protein